MKVIIAVDGSDASLAAVEAFSRRPWAKGAKVRLLSVVQPYYPVPGPAHPELKGDFESATEVLVQEARHKVAEVANGLRARGIDADTVVHAGDPRTEIVAEAERWGAELIVVGSTGRSGFKRWLLGSVAEYVVRHAPCSVEVPRVQPPARE